MLDTSVDGWYNEAECSMLGGACSLAPEGDIVEVGVFKGKSARVLDANRRGRRMILIDTLVCPGADPAQWPTGDGIYHVTTAGGMVMNAPIALLHLDGDHTFAGVTYDLEAYGPLVVMGGRIALHDYGNSVPQNDCRVRQAWEAWEGSKKFAHIGSAESLAVFQRVVE